MRAIFANYSDILAAVKAGHFCDKMHRNCPIVDKEGRIKFPCGRIRLNGHFEGAKKLYAILKDVKCNDLPIEHRFAPISVDICSEEQYSAIGDERADLT